jgi:glycosyltransferase involved in cell wall biosynthesis
MKLLIITPSQGHYGGIEGFVIGLASTIRTWPEFEVQVCFKMVGGQELQGDLKAMASALDCPVHYVKSGDLKIVKLIRWADVIHGQNASPDIVFPAVFFRKKLILSIHNWLQRKLEFHAIVWPIAARMANRRFYNSRFVWNTWEPKEKWKGSECFPSICPECFAPKATCPPAERKGFLFMGRWIPNKGVEDLIIAYSRAKLDPVKWPLTLLGHGPLKPAVQLLIANTGVSGVEIPGFVDEQNKARRLASCRWLVAPSNTREDLGMTPIEARSVGVPAIVTRDGGLPEAGGDAALMVEPGNIAELAEALKRAASMDETEYRERAERGFSTLKTYLRPMEFYRETYNALYKETILAKGAIA